MMHSPLNMALALAALALTCPGGTLRWTKSGTAWRSAPRIPALGSEVRPRARDRALGGIELARPLSWCRSHGVHFTLQAKASL